MHPHRKRLCLPLAAACIFLSGCSTLPFGYSQRDWDALSSVEQQQLRKKEIEASDAIHRALARDAATESGFIRHGAYGPL